MLKRKLQTTLEQWKNDPHRKPLVLRGARQVGKTALVRELAKSFTRYIEINFDETPEKSGYFKDHNVDQVIRFLEIDLGQKVIPNETLIFLDEIQTSPAALHLLRYFYEKRPELHVIAAGSLLEFLLAEHDFSMPVGRIDYCFVYPLTFEEFLGAHEQPALLEYLQTYELSNEIPQALHQKIQKIHQLYSIIGGMPEAMARWFDTENFSEVQKVHSSILQTYEDDFSKYRNRLQPEVLRKTMKKIPTLIGEKIKYSNIDSNLNAAQLSASIQALSSAKIMTCIYHSDGNGVPLGAEINEKKFKALFLDIGLYSTSLSLKLQDLHLSEDIVFINNGAYAEQYVGQELLASLPHWIKPELYYWHRDSKGSNAEIDYLISNGPEVLPIEVKAGKTGSLRSLHTYMAEKGKPFALRFNSDHPSLVDVSTQINNIGKAEYKLLSLPLYLTGQVYRLLGLMA